MGRFRRLLGGTQSGTYLNGPIYVLATDGTGGLEVHGSVGSAPRVAHFTLTATFAAPLDLSYDYCAIEAIGGNVDRDFSAGTKVEIMIGGTWSTPEQRATFGPDRKTVACAFRLRGVAGRDAVQALRITLYSDPWSHQSGVGFRLAPLALGGTYLGATSAAKRPWDATYLAADVAYGVRYRDLQAGTDTGVLTATLDASRFGRVSLGPSGPLGDEAIVSATPESAGDYGDDPAGTRFVMDLLRAGSDGEWRLLTTLPNTDGGSFRDPFEAWEIDAQKPLDATDYAAPPAAPVFSSKGFVAGVPYKGWVAWLQAGGEANVRHSRVGNAEALYSPADGTDDLARGEDFTLADDFADEPLGGVQAGGALLVLGREGVYGQAGDYPAKMTPFRKIPGSMGVCGRFAFARFRGGGGEPGVAWLDRSGENVWLATGEPLFAGDVQARPQELSAPVRGSLRAFLLDGQLDRFSDLALEDVRLDVDEATGALWVVLGARAAVLRPPSLTDGERQWELNDYALGASGAFLVPTDAPPVGPGAAGDLARGSTTLAWSAPANALPGPEVATAGPFAPGLGTHWLVGTGFAPAAPLPLDATIVSVRLVVRHRLIATGPAPTPVTLAAVVSGGLSLLPAHAVPAAFEDFALDLTPLGLGAAALNAGIDARIAYDAVPIDPHAYDAANWSFRLYGNGSVYPTDFPGPYGGSTTFPATVTWVGAGAAPPYVPLSLRSISSCSGPYSVPGNVALDNGQGTRVVGTIPNPPTTGVGPADGTVVYDLPVVGGQATETITITRSNSGTPGDEKDFGMGGVYPAVVRPDPSTVEVESLLLEVAYLAPSSLPPTRIASLAFGPRDEGLAWIRTSGAIDAAEWDPAVGGFVEGRNRDGGAPMPEGWWETGWLSGPTRRLARVEAERDGFGPLTFVAANDRGVNLLARCPTLGRWARFGPAAQGAAFRLRVRVEEATDPVRALDLVYDPLAGPNR